MSFDISSGLTREQRIARIDALATLLDTAFVIPGTQIRLGLDALIGLVPGIGDAISTVMSLFIVSEARALGAPRWLVARMMANVAIDGVVGAVPLVGDVFDVAFRANRRNMALLREHLDKAEGGGAPYYARRRGLMGTPVTVSVPHRLGREEAVRRLKSGLSTMRGNLSSLVTIERENWNGDTLQFDMRGLGQTAAGTITVFDDNIRIEVTLPWLLAKVAERLQPALKREATLLLEKK